MSFWTRLGEFWDEHKSAWLPGDSTQQDDFDLFKYGSPALAGGSVGNLTPGLAWAAAKEDAAAAGNPKGLKAAVAFGMNLSGVTGASEIMHRPYEAIVAHPSSTLFNVLAQTHSDRQIGTQGVGRLFDTQAWKNAWEQSDEISPGQATFAAYGGVDIGDIQSRKAATEYFDDHLVAKLMSGGVDLLANLTLDPLVVGGKLAKASEVARTTVKAGDVADALAVSTRRVGSEKVSKSAARSGNTLNRLYRETDGQSFEELIARPEFKDTGDRGTIALLFEQANKIEDDAARWQAKADLMGVVLGDASSVARLKATQAGLAAQVKNFVTPNQGKVAYAWRLDDYGTVHYNYYNSQEHLAEAMAKQDAIKAELDRLSRLEEIQGSSNRIAPRAGEWFNVPRAQGDARESILYDGLGGKPTVVVHGAFGAKMPGHIDVRDVNNGLDNLHDTISKVYTMTDAERSDYLRRFATAASKEERAKIVWQLENKIYASMGDAYGLKPDELRALVASTRGVRKATRNALRARLYTASEDAPVLYNDQAGGNFIAFNQPWLASQVTDTVPLVDVKALDYVLKADEQTRWLEEMAKRYNFDVDTATRITNGKNIAADFFDDFFEGMMRAWKFAALFRVAYPIRVQVDTQLRNLAILKPLAYTLSLKNGTANLFKNLEKIDNPELLAQQDEIIGALKLYDDKLAQAAAEGASKQRIARLEREREKVRREMDRIPEKVRRGRTEQRASQLRNKETYKGVDITPARDDNELAVLNRTLDSDGTMAAMMTNMTDRSLEEMRATGGWQVVEPADKNWTNAYLRAVNQQIRNSPTARLILEEGFDGSVVQRMKRDPAAIAEYKLVDHAFTSMEDYVAYARSQINHLVNSEVRAIITKRALRESDVKVIFQDIKQAPRVHGEQYSFWKQNTAIKAMGDFASKWYKLASDMPETVMGRHPLYNHQFRRRMKELVDRHGFDEISANDLTRIRRQADRLARKDVADTLFDLTRRSNAADSFRHFSPFFAAWEDTMKKWGKIIYDDPSVMVRGAQVWRAPNEALTVTDDRGNIVRDGKTYDSRTGELITDPAYKGKGEFILLPKALSWGTSGGRVALRKDSFNIVFQGEPWWLPGMGPLVQVPANEIILNLFPKEADNPLFKYLLPVGTSTESIPEQFLPAWARQAKSLITQDTEQYAQVYAMLAAQEYSKDPTKDFDKRDIANKTRNWFILKLAAAIASPVSVAPQPKLQFYIDRAHEYRDKYGLDWQNKFYDDYPEYFEMSLSMSVNSTGITASEQAYDATKRYRKWIEDNPDLGWMFVGPDNVGNFDAGVYDWQQATKVGPGSRKTFRGKEDATDAVARVRAQRGWIEYNKAMTYLQTELERRGLHSLAQKGARDLANAKTQYTEALKKANSDWGRDFDTRDSGKVERGVQAAFAFMRSSPEIAKRRDMQALVQYMQSRDYMREVLSHRTSKKLNDPRNQDLQDGWDQYIAALKADNIGFEQMYNRLLESDDLSREIKV